jgi:hypothetical protein
MCALSKDGQNYWFVVHAVPLKYYFISIRLFFYLFQSINLLNYIGPFSLIPSPGGTYTHI